MESKNLFYGGIDQDIAKDKLQPSKYLDALNMRIVTDEGGTSGNIQNIKGTSLLLEIPNVPAIYSTVATSNDFSVDEVSDITVIINGVSVTFPGITESFTALADAINSNPAFVNINVRAFTNEESIYDEIPTLYITLSEGTLTGVNIIASSASLSTTLFAPNTTNVGIMGWVNMRDDIIIFTTNSSSPTPTGTLGQIWRLRYDKELLTPTFDLLYNNYLNLSEFWPIANPGMIEARYETPAVQNIYWTDNYNVPRSANVADPQLFATDPRLLSLSPIVSPFIPIPTSIVQNTGGLKTGVHYLSFRLSKENGGETNWFPLSYGMNIVETNEETDPLVEWDITVSPYVMTDQGYRGGDTADILMGKDTSKAILYQINGIDTNYTRIEYAHVYKKTFKSLPVIDIVANEPIVSSSTTFLLTGLEEDRIRITLEEFLSANEVFNRVGTLTAKDNYLFAADVETTKLDLDWDARAYRFNSLGDCNIADSLGNLTAVVPPNWDLVPEDHDCINPNDSPIPDGTASGNYLYQSDGTTVGGEGPNISYRFITERILLDGSPQIGLADAIAPYRDVFPKQTVTKNINSSTPIDQEYESPNTFASMHSPYLSGFLRGYTRDEIYRFGIVFYDHSHNPSFVKWIGDIRIPHVYMPNGVNPYDRTLINPICSNSGILYFGESVGIEFTVNNLDQISELISGYSIVRVKRNMDDKTILGQGTFTPAVFDNLSGKTFLPYAESGLPITGILTGGNNRVSAEIASFHSPEFNFDNPELKRTYRSGDQIDILGILENNLTQNMLNRVGSVYQPVGTDEEAKVLRNYTLDSVNNSASITSNTISALTPYDIDATTMAGPWFDGGSAPFDLGTVTDIYNHSSDTSSWAAFGGRGGGKCLVLEGLFGVFGSAGDDITDAAIDNIQNTTRIYLANYKRPLRNGFISTQYGGNTFSQRSRSEYISTNHYQPVRISSTSYVNRIFGGDTFINIFDCTQQFYDDGAAGNPRSGHMMRLFPVETTLNIELRQAIGSDIKISNKYILSTTETMDTEDFLYNPVFSEENDVVTYFPKPEPYLPNNVFDSRIYNSAFPKNNGEAVDSWRTFKPEDYIEVDSQYGPINIIFPHRNRLFFIQDKATGIYQTNEKALVQDAEGGELLLGTGGLKQRFDYISNKIGSKHKFSFTHSKDAVFFFDVINKRAYLVGEGLTELQGLNGFFQRNIRGDIIDNDNPYLFKGITSTYDYKFDEFLVTFFDIYQERTEDGLILVPNYFTLIYNPAIKAFTSKASFTPKTYINDKFNVFSPDTTNRLFTHNVGAYGEFYDTIYPAYVEFILNDKPDIEKIFDNLLINSKSYLNGVDAQDSFFNTFKVYNDYQNTGDKLFTDNGRFLRRKWNVTIGGDQGNTTRTERIKSNYAITRFTTDNQDNLNLVLEAVVAKYRVNPTML